MIRSITADDLPAEEVLYRRHGVTVMPSWLEIDGRDSLAVRSMVQLSMDEQAPPRATAIVFCLVALVLALISGTHILRASLPLSIAWAALAASIGLVLFTSHLAFIKPTLYTLDITFTDGSRRLLKPPDKVAMLEIHRALSRAMERQRGWR